LSSPTPHEGIILIDEEEQDPILDFGLYSDAIVKIIKGSIPKFSIGIYSEWGTGKTTLMKMVQRKLTETTFRWDFVPGEDKKTYLGIYLKLIIWNGSMKAKWNLRN
jgi:Cdc6-like AAA superfamily ATPase